MASSKYVLFLLSVLLIPVLYFAFGVSLFFIYLLVWLDKIILGLFKLLRYFGIELTTLATVFAAIYFGPVVSSFLILFLFTFLQSLRYLIVPVNIPEYPLFVPNTDSIIYALGGIVAGFTLQFGFATAVVAVVITKHLMYIAKALIFGKLPSFTGLIGGVIFHLVAVIPIGLSFIELTG
jgi:hypothetical protein